MAKKSDAERIAAVESYIMEAVRLFAIDPPDTDFQSGYLEGILVIAREGLGMDLSNPAPTSPTKTKPQLRLVKLEP